MADRTLTFSLHCHADIPFKMKSKILFKKQFLGNGKQITPESGFVDFSGTSTTEPSSSFPSVAQSLLGSRNISLTAVGNVGAMNSTENLSHVDIANRSSNTETQSKDKDKRGGLPRIVPDPSKCKLADTKLPEMVKPGLGLRTKPALLPPSVVPSSASAARLNLPPLRQTRETLVENETDQLSDSTTVSGTLADSDDPHATSNRPNRNTTTRGVKNPPRKNYSTDSTSTLSDSSSDVCTPTFTNVGRFCRGFAFDEIYCGEEYTFLYSGLLPGATYYFRVHCHNAAGWGPWSDTVKCTTVQGKVHATVFSVPVQEI